MDTSSARHVLMGLHEEFMLTIEQREAINTALDRLTMEESASKLDDGLDRADEAMAQALKAGEVQTQLLRTLVEQTRYQYLHRYRVDTRTGKIEEIPAEGYGK